MYIFHYKKYNKSMDEGGSTKQSLCTCLYCCGEGDLREALAAQASCHPEASTYYHTYLYM